MLRDFSPGMLLIAMKREAAFLTRQSKAWRVRAHVHTQRCPVTDRADAPKMKTPGASCAPVPGCGLAGDRHAVSPAHVNRAEALRGRNGDRLNRAKDAGERAQAKTATARLNQWGVRDSVSRASGANVVAVTLLRPDHSSGTPAIRRVHELYQSRTCSSPFESPARQQVVPVCGARERRRLGLRSGVLTTQGRAARHVHRAAGPWVRQFARVSTGVSTLRSHPCRHRPGNTHAVALTVQGRSNCTTSRTSEASCPLRRSARRNSAPRLRG